LGGGTVRDAELADLDTLSALAFASKAHWGYDDAFMEACRAELTVQPVHLEGYVVRVAESDGAIVGFHAVERTSSEPELMWLFVAPAAMGRGVGRALLDDAVSVARALGAEVLTIDSDPNASGFYERVGARVVGATPSVSIPNRMLPRLVLEF
jgi:GNAT superfamily N-acetyltransferase